MNNPDFFIFGVPHGFNLFQGNADNISYFQNSFYDRSREKTKLVIHRKVNGQVSYSYLKYCFLSCEDRAGAFFGMSVVFNGEYCKDTAKLYRLFEFVYRDIILEDRVLLEEIKGNANTQGKFLIHTFNEQEAKIRNIEDTILVNIRDEFANDILPLNSSFVQGKANLVRKINAKQDNKVILEALQTYSWVSISLDYPEGQGFDEISEEGKKALRDTADKIKDAIIENYKELSANAAKVRNNANQLKATVTDILKTINAYIKKQPELQELKETYLNIQKQLTDLKNAASQDKSIGNFDNDRNTDDPEDKGNGEGKIIFDGQEYYISDLLQKLETELDKIQQNAGCDAIIKSNTATEAQKEQAKQLKEKEEKGKKSSWFNKIKIDKSFLKYAAITFVVIGIGVALFLSRPEKKEDSSNPNATEYQHLFVDFDSYLSKGFYDNAWNTLEKLRKNGENGENVSNQQRNLINSVNSKIEELKNTTKEDDLRKAKQLLVKSVEYGSTNDITQDTIDITESIRLIQAINAVKENPPKYEFAKSLCDNILKTRCSENIKNQAKTLYDSAQAKTKEAGKAEKKTQVKKTEQESTPNGDCRFEYQIASKERRKSWQTSELMQELKKRFEQGSYQVVIDGCIAIIESCESYKAQAKELKIKAEGKKSFNN